MNSPMFLVIKVVKSIDCFTYNIEKSAKGFVTYRNFDSVACINNFHILAKTFTCRKHNAANTVAADMLANLHNKFLTV